MEISLPIFHSLTALKNSPNRNGIFRGWFYPRVVRLGLEGLTTLSQGRSTPHTADSAQVLQVYAALSDNTQIWFFQRWRWPLPSLHAFYQSFSYQTYLRVKEWRVNDNLFFVGSGGLKRFERLLQHQNPRMVVQLLDMLEANLRPGTRINAYYYYMLITQNYRDDEPVQLQQLLLEAINTPSLLETVYKSVVRDRQPITTIYTLYRAAQNAGQCPGTYAPDLGKKSQDDLSAIARIHDILNTEAPKSKSLQSWMKSTAFNAINNLAKPKAMADVLTHLQQVRTPPITPELITLLNAATHLEQITPIIQLLPHPTLSEIQTLCSMEESPLSNIHAFLDSTADIVERQNWDWRLLHPLILQHPNLPHCQDIITLMKRNLGPTLSQEYLQQVLTQKNPQGLYQAMLPFDGSHLFSAKNLPLFLNYQYKNMCFNRVSNIQMTQLEIDSETARPDQIPSTSPKNTLFRTQVYRGLLYTLLCSAFVKKKYTRPLIHLIVQTFP